MDKKLMSIFNQILEQNTENFSNNEVFGMVSLITLNQIINIYQNIKATSDEQNLNSLVNNIGKQSSDNNGNMDLEKLLPLLMSLLGNKNNLGNLLNSLNTSRNNNQNRKIENEEDNHEQEKKNTKYVKKN